MRFAFVGFVLLFIASPGDAQTPGIAVDKEKKSVTIDAKIAPRKLEYLKGEIYPIEVIACLPHPKGKKAHETVVTIDVKPSDVHKALEAVGLKPGKPAQGEEAIAEGPECTLYLELPNSAGKRVPIEKTLVDPKTNKPMPKTKYRFTGSVQTKPDPDKPDTIYGADATGTLIAVFPVTNETVMQSPLPLKDSKFLKLETNKQLLPAEGTAVKLVIEAAN